MPTANNLIEAAANKNPSAEPTAAFFGINIRLAFNLEPRLAACIGAAPPKAMRSLSPEI